MTEIQRPGALYQQVAAAIREAILSGEFAPDSPLPSEAQLIARYGVSRPTVRNAIAALRAEGLIDVRHGKGSFVRSDGQPALTIERRISRSSDGGFIMPNGDEWEEAEEPPRTAPAPPRPPAACSGSPRKKRCSAVTDC